MHCERDATTVGEAPSAEVASRIAEPLIERQNEDELQRRSTGLRCEIPDGLARYWASLRDTGRPSPVLLKALEHWQFGGASTASPRSTRAHVRHNCNGRPTDLTLAGARARSGLGY
jgi:hypothetical protein